MTMRCPACGSLFEDGGRSCTRDGARLQPVLPPPPTWHARAPRTPRSPEEGPKRVGPGQLVGTLLDGRYRVVRKLGEGGMSYVYLADDTESGTRIAIKVLSPALVQDAKAMARLRREAGFGARLAHPNVCHIERVAETADGLVFVVMPFVDGELLTDRTQRFGRLPVAEALQITADVAAGLDVAHQLGIIHRDLKPENIMVREDADRPRAVVMDFGLAKERQLATDAEQLTGVGVILGTPEFMSPEQLRGRPLDARTDVYSLALVTYEMLTGQLPFDGRSPQEVMIARLRGDPIPLRKRRPELNLPAGVERVLQRALSREPESRPSTAPELAAALLAAADESELSTRIGRLFSR